MPDNSRDRRSLLGAQFLGLGFVFLAELGSLTALGWWIDREFRTAPWLTLIGAVLGMMIAMAHLLRGASAYEAAVAEQKRRAEKDAGEDGD